MLLRIQCWCPSWRRTEEDVWCMLVNSGQEARKKKTQQERVHFSLQPLARPFLSLTRGGCRKRACACDGVWVEEVKSRVTSPIPLVGTIGLWWDKTRRKYCPFIIFMFCSLGSSKDSSLGRNSTLPEWFWEQWAGSWSSGEKSKKEEIADEG